MKTRLLTVSALAIALSLYAVQAGFAVSTADPTPATKNAQTQTQAQDQIYGSQLMTQQERVEFRTKMQAATTVEEQEQIRNEHHKAMQERAVSQGIVLPDQSPAGGGGMMGPGSGMGSGNGGMGSGMGSGSGGMGPGSGRGQ